MSTSIRNTHDRGSLTYEPHFGLREKPFSLLPAAHFFFRAAPHKAAFDALLTGIRRREGILALTGEVGTGKTTLCRAVLDALDRKTFAAFIRDPIVSREDLLKALLVDFGVVSVDEIRGGHLRGASRTELSYPLYDFLTALQPLDAFAVVMIDEAQNIPQALLEELRILSDLDNGQRLLQLMLIGQPELDARLAAPEMRQLTQRISLRCELSPLTAADVKLYIRHRLTVAGNGDVGFSDRAINLITAATAGVPRAINLVCDRAMSRAAELGASSVNADHVIGATSDLKWPRTPLGSIAWEGDDLPLPVSRPDEAGRRSRAATGLNLGDLEPRTPPLLSREAASGQLAGTSAQREAPPATHAGRRTGELGLLIPPRLDAPDRSARRRRRRGFLVAAGAALVILGGSAWWGWLNPAAEQERANRIEAPISAAASLPAATESPALSGQDVNPTASTPEPPAAESVQPRRYAVQVATFSSDASAAQSMQEFLQAGFPAYSIESTLRDGGRAKAVFVGPYADLATAEQERERVQQVPGYGAGQIVTVR